MKAHRSSDLPSRYLLFTWAAASRMFTYSLCVKACWPCHSLEMPILQPSSNLVVRAPIVVRWCLTTAKRKCTCMTANARTRAAITLKQTSSSISFLHLAGCAMKVAFTSSQTASQCSESLPLFCPDRDFSARKQRRCFIGLVRNAYFGASSECDFDVWCNKTGFLVEPCVSVNCGITTQITQQKNS